MQRCLAPLAFLTLSVGWPNFLIGQTPVSTRIKVLREVETENRFRGTIGLFTVVFPLGGQAPPNQAPAVTAKY